MRTIGGNHIALCLLGIFLLSGLVITLAVSNLIHSSSISSNAIQRHEYVQRGLFYECLTLINNDQATCNKIGASAKVTNLPSYLAYSRFAVIAATVLCFIATVCSLLGNPFMRCCKFNHKVMTFVTAGSYLLSGILSLVAYSWYTNAAMNNYVEIMGEQLHNDGGKFSNTVSQWDLGWGMYIGFVTSILAILGSVHACVVAVKLQKIGDVVNDMEDYNFKEGESSYI